MTTCVHRSLANNVIHAKRLTGEEKIAEHKRSNHAQVDSANDKISATAVSERKTDDLRIKT